MKKGFKPPKFLIRFFERFRKWKLGMYKKKKVRQEKTKHDRTYFVRFKIKIEDPINPQESFNECTMMVPAKAAFFAKIKARRAMMEKIDFYFSECELVSDEQLEYFEKSRDKYIAKKMKD